MYSEDWQLALQRFLADEMGEHEERRFLAECDLANDRWRTVALEMIEWRTVGRLLDHEHAIVVTPESKTKTKPSSLHRWLPYAIAASLLVCFAGGWWSGRSLPQMQMVARIEQKDTIVQPTTPAPVYSTWSDQKVTLPVLTEEEAVYPEHPFLQSTHEINVMLGRLGLEAVPQQSWIIVHNGEDSGVMFPRYAVSLQQIARKDR